MVSLIAGIIASVCIGTACNSDLMGFGVFVALFSVNCMLEKDTEDGK